MQHLALRVKNDEELMRDARSHPLERHTRCSARWTTACCKSIYFAGLENLSLELS